MSIREIQSYLQQKEFPDEFLKLCIQDTRIGVQRLARQIFKQRADEQAEAQRISSMLIEEMRLWERGYLLVAGIDEAGRGPLAGPVVAAACILPATFNLPGLNDSKRLSEKKREILYQEIVEQAVAYSIGTAESTEIDALNIYQATRLAMKRAVEGLKVRPHYLLVDGNMTLDIKISQKGLIGGDRISASIAAASILAKVTRDRMMEDLHTLYPEYGFASNKGYGTKEHLQALRQLGPCPIHRKSFARVDERSAP